MHEKPTRMELEQQIRALEKRVQQFEQREENYRLNEVRLETLNLLQRMTAASLNEITDFALESSVALTKSTIGYIAFLNRSEDVLTMHSWSRHAMRDCAMQTKPIHYPVEKTGLWGEAVRQRQPIVTNDYHFSNPLKKGFPEGHVQLKRHMNVPIMDGDHIVMVAGVANKAEAYDDSDVRQLILLMQGTWNILQRKRASEELHGQIDLLEGIINAIDDIISIQYPSHIVERYNKAGYEMLGMTPEQVKGKKCYTLLGRDKECDQCPTSKAIYTMQPTRLEKWVPELNRWFDCRSNPLLDKNGNVIHIIQQLRDVTDKKLAEEEKELLRSRLFHSQKMEALGTLTGGVAHDFNNILTIIAGYAELLSDDLGPGHPAMINIEKIKAASMRAKNVVGHLLTFCRKGETEQTPGEIGPIIRDAMKIMRSITPENVLFRENIPDGLPPILADPIQVHQVVVNLCKNAIDAMAESGGIMEVSLQYASLPLIEISFDPELLPGDYLKLTIADTGHGIAPENLKRIFDPYFTTRDVGKGTGLGLSVALGIVKRHGGTIRVESKIDQGSTFNIFFPIADNNDLR
jgi:PAS domain S-box-containing protein